MVTAREGGGEKYTFCSLAPCDILSASHREESTMAGESFHPHNDKFYYLSTIPLNSYTIFRENG